MKLEIIIGTVLVVLIFYIGLSVSIFKPQDYREQCFSCEYNSLDSIKPTNTFKITVNTSFDALSKIDEAMICVTGNHIYNCSQVKCPATVIWTIEIYGDVSKLYLDFNQETDPSDYEKKIIEFSKGCLYNNFSFDLASIPVWERVVIAVACIAFLGLCLFIYLARDEIKDRINRISQFCGGSNIFTINTQQFPSQTYYDEDSSPTRDISPPVEEMRKSEESSQSVNGNSSKDAEKISETHITPTDIITDTIPSPTKPADETTLSDGIVSNGLKRVGSRFTIVPISSTDSPPSYEDSQKHG